MPIYDYACYVCDFKWEITHSIHDEPKRKCPRCKKLSLERLISGGVHVYVVVEATNLGQLAERNTKKMGKELQQKETDKKNDAIKEAGFNTVDDTTRKLRKMTPEQKAKWIIEGD